MKTGSDQLPDGTGTPSLGEDETLEVVRLMIAAETGASQPHSDSATDEAGDAEPEPGKGLHDAPGGKAERTPRKATGQSDPTRLAPHVPGDLSRGSLFDPLKPQAAPNGEDSGQGGWKGKALRLPSLRMPRIRWRSASSQERPDQGGQADTRARAILCAKLAALGGAALLLVLKPWLLPLLIFMAIWLALVLFLLLGSTRISEMTAKAWAFYSARRPERAARIYKALQRGADRVDGLLARLPEKWTEGIYTPELGRSELGLSAARRAVLEDDPFSRLAQEGARSGRDGPGRSADTPSSQAAAAK